MLSKCILLYFRWHNPLQYSGHVVVEFSVQQCRSCGCKDVVPSWTTLLPEQNKSKNYSKTCSYIKVAEGSETIAKSTG